jgi:hypothetical protein
MTIDDLEVVPVLGLDGRPFLEARVPRIERRFRSDLHRPENRTVQLGSWRGELEQVRRRRAPIARLVTDEAHLLADHDPGDSEAIRSAVIGALADGFVGGIMTWDEGVGEPRVEGRVALPDRIADTVDLDDLRADYERWFAAADVLDVRPMERYGWKDSETVAELIGHAFDDLGLTWSTHLWELDRYGPGSVDGGIKHGLVTGADPAQTCAYILSRIDPIPSRHDSWWHSLR